MPPTKSNLQEAWDEYDAAREALLEYRRKLNESSQRATALLDDGKVKRQAIIDRITALAHVINRQPHEFHEPVADPPFIDEMLLSFLNGNYELTRLAVEHADLKARVLNARRRYRTAYEKLPGLIASDRAGILGNDLEADDKQSVDKPAAAPAES